MFKESKMRGLAFVKKLLPLSLAFTLVLSLTACGEVEMAEPYSGNRMIYLAASDSGEKPIRLLLIESFTEQYYDADELYDYALEEVNGFNEENASLSEDGRPMEVISVFDVALPEESNCIALDFRFTNGEAYNAYFEKECFYGTVAQAVEAGYSLSEVSFVNTRNGKTLASERLEKYMDSYIFIYAEDVQVRCADKIAFASSNVTVDTVEKTDGYYATSSAGEELKYIILK